MDATILRSEALRIIDSGAAFSMEYVQCDRRRGIAGKLKEVKGWKKVTGTPAPESLPGKFTRQAQKLVKDPHHDEHDTFNIFNPQDRAAHPHKVHCLLIISFNGKRVING